MNKPVAEGILEIFGYVVVFLSAQAVMSWLVAVAALCVKGVGLGAALRAVTHGGFAFDGQQLAIATAMSSVLIITLFIWRKWASASRLYLSTRPWTVLCWVAVLTIGTILPSEWMVERINLTMPEHMEKMFEDIMGSPAGYLSIGILAPLAEELVFRGAILRTLLKLFSNKAHWLAIVISALIFGGLHMNLPQFVHAFVIGLLIGWMYYRTDSIVPGVVLHWVNNTVAYVMFNLMPQAADGKLIDLFHGDDRMMTGGLIFSLCILIPSLFQLSFRLKK